MGFINCGAFDMRTGNRVKTKKALREAIADDPANVSFDKTALHDGGGRIRGDEIPEGAILSVVLPDPYRDRRAYASVSRKADGSVKVA